MELSIDLAGVEFPAWFPSRAPLSLVFSAFTRPGVLGLLRYVLTTGTVTSLYDTAGQARQAVVSPDGGYVAFMLQGEDIDNPDIQVLELSTGSSWRVTTPNTGLNQRPEWSPDGKLIYFETFRTTGAPDIWRVARDGGDEQPVVQGLNSSNPELGRYVAFFLKR